MACLHGERGRNSLDCNWYTRVYQSLICARNALAGRIPTQLGQLTQLKKLSLQSNQLTGECRETHLIAIGKRVYHSPSLMCRQYSDGARTLDGDGGAGHRLQQVNRYDSRVAMLREMVNESTTTLQLAQLEVASLISPALHVWLNADTAGFQRLMKQKVPRATVRV